jgi:ribonuclease VapC
MDASDNLITSSRADERVKTAQISIEVVTPAQAHVARNACRNFGSGSARGSTPVIVRLRPREDYE